MPAMVLASRCWRRGQLAGAPGSWHLRAGQLLRETFHADQASVGGDTIAIFSLSDLSPSPEAKSGCFTNYNTRERNTPIAQRT